MGEAAFDCKRCGHCCQGEGGIVLTQHDRERLAAHLNLSIEDMLQQFAEQAGDKQRLRVGLDEYCIFFRAGLGCGVHLGRPDICRAWPYFRGNLVDETSWKMIQTDCPGVKSSAGHEAFVQEGVDYLYAQGLVHEPGPETPHALVLTDLLKARRRK